MQCRVYRQGSERCEGNEISGVSDQYTTHRMRSPVHTGNVGAGVGVGGNTVGNIVGKGAKVGGAAGVELGVMDGATDDTTTLVHVSVLSHTPHNSHHMHAECIQC